MGKLREILREFADSVKGYRVDEYELTSMPKAEQAIKKVVEGVPISNKESLAWTRGERKMKAEALKALGVSDAEATAKD